MKKSKIIIISILTSILLLGGIFVFAYFTFFYNVKGSEIVLENVKFQVNDSPNKGEEDVVYFTTDDLTQGDGYQINLNYSLNGNFVSNYAMKYKTFFEVTDTNNISTAIDVYRFYDDSYHYVDKLSNLIYDESDENNSSIYTDFLGVTGTHCEKFLLVYSMGSTIEDKNSFNLKISTKSEMVTTTSAEFPYFYLNDMGSSGDDNSNAETAESILKQLPSNDLIYGRTIVLMRDITYTTPTNITFENLVGIDLNGHKLNLAGGSLVFKDTNESASVNYNNKIGIYDSVGTGSFDNTKVTINYTKSVIDIDSDFYNDNTKLINGSTFTISKISLDAFGNAAKEKFAYITQTKHTVNNGSYTFDLFGNLKYYLLSNSLSMDTNNIAVSSARGEAEATLNADKTITVSNITNSDSISLTLTASGFDTQAQINDILQLYGSTTDSCKEYLESYIPKKLDGSIYLPSYISTFNSYITWISYDENLINKNGMVLPNGYFNLDNWVSQRTNLGFIIDQSGEQMSGVIKDIEITVLTVEERVELLFDPISVTFNNDDSTTYNFDLIEMLYKKYDSTNLAEIASTYFNITIDTTLSDEAQREAFIAALTNKIGLTKVVVSNNQEPAFVEETISQAQDTLVQGVTNLTQSGVPNEVVSLVYTLTYSFTDGSIEKYKLFNVNIGEAAVTLVDLTNSLRVPFDTYSKYMTDYEVVDGYNHYNTYSNRFQLVPTFDGISINYTVPSEYSDYVRIDTNSSGQKVLTIIKDNVPADTHTVTIVANVNGVDSPIYLPFTCIGILHNVTSRGHAEFEDGKLYIELLNTYDKNLDQILTDLEAKNSSNVSLSLTNKSITSLKGLKYFSNLTSINFSSNKIVDISDLSEMNNLVSVNLSNNNITSLDAFKFSDNIRILNLSKNSISSIEPIQYLNELTSLDISNNTISDFKYIENLASLTELKVYSNSNSNGPTVSIAGNTDSPNIMTIRCNQYYFNLLNDKYGTNVYIAGNSVFEFSDNFKIESKILNNIVPIDITSDTIVLPTYINYNNTNYEISYFTEGIDETFIRITRNDSNSNYKFRVTNIELVQLPVNNLVTIYAHTVYLSGSDFYRPLSFYIRNGVANIEHYGEIEIESGQWAKAKDVIKDSKLLSALWVKYDTNPVDGVITNAELNPATAVTLNFDSLKIETLEGIQYFGNIQSLNLRNNNLIDENNDGYADLKYISYLTSLKTLYLSGQLFNFNDLIFYTRLKSGSTYVSQSTTNFEVNGINGIFDVQKTYGLINLTNLYVTGCQDLNDYEQKTALYHIYLNNSNLNNIYKDSNSVTWNPVSEEINKLLGSLTTSATFINYNDTIQISNSYDFYMYDDLYPTSFTLSKGAISSNEYVFAGGSADGKNSPNNANFKQVYYGYDSDDEDKFEDHIELTSLNTSFIDKNYHKLADYFEITNNTTNNTFDIKYKKLIYKDYQAYLKMTLSTNNGISQNRKSYGTQFDYYLTLFMQYNNDYTFYDDNNIDSSMNGKSLNAVFGAVETMLFIMNGLSDELRLNERSYDFTITDKEGIITKYTNNSGSIEAYTFGIANYVVKTSEISMYDGSFNGTGEYINSDDFSELQYFFIHGNFMPTATSALDGLRFLPQIKKVFFRRDAVLGTGKDLINVKELFLVYTYLNLQDFNTVLNNLEILILAQGTGTNISDESSLDSNPNSLIESYMVWFPKLLEFYFNGEGSNGEGEMYEWSAFLAYSYIPYNQIYMTTDGNPKTASNEYKYYSIQAGIEKVGGMILDDDELYYCYDSSVTDYTNFGLAYYINGSPLSQSIITENANTIFATTGDYYDNIYFDSAHTRKLPTSNQIFRHVQKSSINLVNFKISGSATNYSNTYENQIVLIEAYNNLITGYKTHYYLKNSPAVGNTYDFNPEFSMVEFETDVTKEYNELTPFVSDLHLKLTGKTFNNVTLNNTEYSSLSWENSDYSDYYRQGLVVILPKTYDDFKIGYSKYDNKYRSFKIDWYVSYTIDNSHKQYTSILLGNSNGFNASASSALSVFSNQTNNSNNLTITINSAGYYLFEGVLTLSDGTNSYAFNTSYDKTESKNSPNQYDMDIAGSVSIIYPITITSIKNYNTTINNSINSMYKITKQYVQDDGTSSIGLKWFDTIIDRTFKFTVFMTYATSNKAFDASIEFNLDIDATFNNENNKYSLIDRILNKLFGVNVTKKTTSNSSINNKNYIRTFAGLSRLISDIYTFEGWETLNVTKFNYCYGTMFSYLPARFPAALTTLNVSSVQGITNFGGLLSSNITSAKIYMQSNATDSGLSSVGQTHLGCFSDSLFDLYDYITEADYVTGNKKIKLQSLEINDITEESLVFLSKIAKAGNIDSTFTLTLRSLSTYNMRSTFQFYDYQNALTIYNNLKENDNYNKLAVKIESGASTFGDLYNSLDSLIEWYDKLYPSGGTIENHVYTPGRIVSGSYFMTDGTPPSDVKISCSMHANWSNNNFSYLYNDVFSGSNVNADFMPNPDTGYISYYVALQKDNFRIYKRLEGQTAETESGIYTVKVATFKTGVKTGTNISYGFDDLNIYDKSSFDENFINLILSSLSSKYNVTASINSQIYNVVSTDIKWDSTNKKAITSGYAYILDTELGRNSQTYYLIINTEYFTNIIRSNKDLTSLHYTVFDMKGFELLPFKAIKLTILTPGDNCYLNIERIINSNGQVTNPKIEYFEIGENYFVFPLIIYDISGFDYSLTNNATIKFGYRIKVKQKLLKYSTSEGIKFNSTKNFNVTLNYEKLKVLFDNDDYDTSFNYMYAKQEIAKTILNNSPKVWKDIKDYYFLYNSKKTEILTKGEFSNITMYTNLMNHPFNQPDGNIFEDSVYNYAILNTTVVKNKTANYPYYNGGYYGYHYIGTKYDEKKVVAYLMNVHSDNIRSLSDDKTLSMLYNSSSAETPRLDTVYSLSVGESIKLSSRITTYVGTRPSEKNVCYYIDDLDYISSDGTETYFKTVQPNMTQYFSFKRYNDYWEITLTDNTLLYTRLRFSLGIYEDSSTATTDYIQNKNVKNRRKNTTVLGRIYVDVNYSNSYGRQMIKPDEPLYLPKTLILMGQTFTITYYEESDNIKCTEKTNYYQLELDNENASSEKEIYVTATLSGKKYMLSGGTYSLQNYVFSLDFYVDVSSGSPTAPSNNYSTFNGNMYVEVLVNKTTNEIVPGSLVLDYSNDSNYEYRIIDATSIFDSGLLLSDMFYGAAISIGSTDYTQHSVLNDTNYQYYPKYVVVDANNNFVRENDVLKTFANNDKTSADTYINNNNGYSLALIYTKEQIANIHYFSNTRYISDASKKIDFRAQSTLEGIQIFPLTHVRFGYIDSNDSDWNDQNNRAFPGNYFGCLKDMKLEEFKLVFKHTSIYVSDWTFLFNSRKTLTKFSYGGILTNQSETYGTTHDDFSFLLSFNNLESINIIGLTGIEYTQSFQYFVMRMYNLKGNIIHYFRPKNSTSSIESVSVVDLVETDVINASLILNNFNTTSDSNNISSFTYQNEYELYLGDNSSNYSSITNYDLLNNSTQYLLPSYINDGGTYYKLTYASLSNFAEIVAIKKSDSSQLSMLQYQEAYATYVIECLTNGDEVNDYEFASQYDIYVRFYNLANCLTDRIMISAKIECQSKIESKDIILEDDLSSDTLKDNYVNGIGYLGIYYDGKKYVYTPYTYQRFLSIYVDHTAVI